MKTSVEKALIELSSVLSVTFKDIKTGKDITARFAGAKALISACIKQFIYDIFSIGLARNPDAVSQRFLQLATICRSQDLANFERMCNRIAAQYELFEKKSVLFSADYLMDDLCALILQCEEIEKGNVNRDTIGVFKEQYNQIPPTEFHGLGAYQWHSGSGYTGITSIFYSPELSGTAN